MSEQVRVVHVRDNVPGAIYIGRANGRAGLKASKWHNPHRIGPDCDRRDAVRRYGADLLLGDRRYLLAELHELRGKPLACWCRRDGERHVIGENDCHADVLAGFLRAYSDARLIELAEGDH